MAETINYGLYIEDDSSVLFRDWRQKMNGSSDSNIVKIDAILKEIASAGVIDIVTTESEVSGGENKITFTLATGKQVDFTVRNGTDGIADIYIGDGPMPDDCKLQILPGGGNAIPPSIGGGGYYTPSVTQIDTNTIKISFEPNLDGMNEVEDKIISMPSSGLNTFVVNIESTDMVDNLAADKTFNEILGAHSEGHRCVAKYGCAFYDLLSTHTSVYVFQNISRISSGDISVANISIKADNSIVFETYIMSDKINSLIDERLGVIEDGYY